MRTFVYGVLLGLTVGIGGVFLLSTIGERATSPAVPVVRDIAAAQFMDAAETDAHRSNHFANLETIESLLALPNDALRNEAMSVLAGRSDFEGLRVLAEDANRILNPYWREQSLRIIFQRLANLEPEFALELARSERFFASRVAQAMTIRTWARDDLMGAVSAVATLDDRTQDMTAQMLYGAIGGAYTPEAEFVEQEIGIAPSESNRSRFVRELFAVSPDAVLDHILALESAKHRTQQIRLTGYLYAFSDYDRAQTFSARILDADLRRNYLEVVYGQLAKDHPLDAAKLQFALNDGVKLSKNEKRAFQLIAREDFDSAIALFSDPVNQGIRGSLGEGLARQYAKRDPRKALLWASQSDPGIRQSLIAHVVRAVADTDPELAMRQVTGLKPESQERGLTLDVFGRLASESPGIAAQMINLISNPATRQVATSNLAAIWFREDMFLALDWLSTTDEETQRTAYSQRGLMQDLDLGEAQSLVLSMPVEHRKAWLIEVVDRLINEQSGDAAMSFIEQFSGQEGHERQVGMVVTRLARKNTDQALRYIDGIRDGQTKDGVLSTMVYNEVRDNPAKAATFVPMVVDPDLRQNAAARIASSWLQSDPVAARRWLNSMPGGADRDNILMNTAIDHRLDDAMKTELVQQISDVDKRNQAMLFQSMGTADQDPEEVARLLEEIEMPELFRQQIKSQLFRQSVSGR